MADTKGTENTLILVTGGCRSGKSDFAQQVAERIDGPRLFIATCPCTDKETAERIRLHQAARIQAGWQTIEEQILVEKSIRQAKQGTTIVIDCLTLWISNLLLDADSRGALLTEQELIPRVNELGHAAGQHCGTVIMVSGEVGQGIVPENRLARRYRDLVGRCNRSVAALADQVFLVSCGIALQLK
ncbi:MAG TPA: bifunctional adenosylcobinamide kinase/adenosylcobinamide-phosphate guanylyltransferase [Desulfobulbus sp.]|nr:bifunctional adenosylcobinamide kinase/adenosylcobinamide-phosphate guanylyltransferase [Desulfobulbus sp.]